MDALNQLTFVDIDGGTFDLGWRFDDVIDPAARAELTGFLPWDEIATRLSPARQATLPGFAIATTSVAAEELLADIDDDDDHHLMSIEALCDAVDQRLRPHGLRLPSEDELEAACGGGIFPWGNQVPDGVPWGKETSFQGHRQPNSRGLRLNHDSYKVELCRAAFKLGDGGEAVCGGYPPAVAWLSFAPSFRMVGESVEDLLFEFLEGTMVRPVRL